MPERVPIAVKSTIDWIQHFDDASSYDAFLEKYATDVHVDRWRQSYEATILSPDLMDRIRTYVRSMKVLCLAGTWCGDCAAQCTIFRRIAEAAAPGLVDLRFVDRDDAPAELSDALRINGGQRVPAVIFLSEEGFETARYGEKTLAKYRQEAASLQGEACSLGLASAEDPVLRQAVISEWADQFERAQLILRLSPRLRRKYGD